MATLTIMGSGETTPTMVTTHQRVLAAVDATRSRVLLDTPYGFQENADEITAKAQAYLERNVGTRVEVASLRRADTLTAVQRTAVEGRVAEAGWVFAGPGSPTYLARQWLATALPDVLRGRLRPDAGVGTATVFASAAAVTLGAHVIPVYEIYKAGEAPRWEPGLDLLAAIGLDVALIPHFDNAEGGTHDTRFCYLGETRLRIMEEQLPGDTWVLGVDEHTALLADLASGRVEVTGRGGVTVRARDHHLVVPSGETTTLEALIAAARGTADGAAPAGLSVPAAVVEAGGADGHAAADEEGGGEPVEVGSLAEAVTTAAHRFDVAVADDRPLDAAEATVWLLDQAARWATDVNQSDEADRATAETRRQIVGLARLADAGLHEHADLVAPLVDLLLELRDQARADRSFAVADRIRDTLTAAGVEVRDARDGSGWVYDDPLDAARPG